MVQRIVSAATPHRIALMLESDGPGGAEMMLLQLAEELRRRGHFVLPVGPEHGAGWLGERFRESDFAPATFALHRPLDWRCLRELTRLLRDQAIDVVHSHEFTMAVYGTLAARRIGARHVITMHGGQYFAERWRRRAAMRWAVRRSAALVAVSGATASHLHRSLGLDASAVTVVPNGIAFRSGHRQRVREELALADDTLLVLAVGNLYPVKGHRTLLDALGLVCRANASLDWRLAIAGRGEETDALEALARGQGIADRVHLLGFRPDVPDLLSAADVFAMPSHSEGLPLALVEAMGAGLPVIASAVGGIPEVVRTETDGILVPPRDPSALGDALVRVMSDAVLRRTLGDAARARVQREYAVSTMAERYEALYRPESDARATMGSGRMALAG